MIRKKSYREKEVRGEGSRRKRTPIPASLNQNGSSF